MIEKYGTITIEEKDALISGFTVSGVEDQHAAAIEILLWARRRINACLRERFDLLVGFKLSPEDIENGNILIKGDEGETSENTATK